MSIRPPSSSPSGSSVAWQGCQVTQAGSGANGQSIPNNVEELLAWDVERKDTGGFHSTAANTSRFVAVAGKAGFYRLIASLAFNPHATGRREILCKKNGTVYLPGVSTLSVGGANATCVQLTIEVELAEGDYLEVFAFQNSGGALTLYKADAFSPEVTFRYLGVAA